MNDDKYSKEIRKTGFVLEYKVAESLRQSGWTVISNKYYEDDFEGSVREIDLLAYKAKTVQNVSVYTALLISCKKNDTNVWALLARDINLKDPNADWWPLHAWSNDKAIAHELSKQTTPKAYHEDLITLGVTEVLTVPQYEVFAFQEMNRTSGSPQNDKSIFSSVTSLLKAQAYELGALSQRKKKPCVYQFNLISIIDSDLIRLVIQDENITQEAINSEHYISRYIIKRSETFSRIRFIAHSSFKEKLKQYDFLHESNCKWFDKKINEFYKDILKDYTRSNVLIEEFRNDVWWELYWILRDKCSAKIDKTDISIGWSKEDDSAKISIVTSDEAISFLNSNPEIRKTVEASLEKIYRYSGNFIFEVDDIPF